MTEDGGGIGWGDHFSPLQIHQKNISTLSKFYKTTSECWQRTSGTQQSRSLASKTGRKKYKTKKETKAVGSELHPGKGILSWEETLKKRGFQTGKGVCQGCILSPCLLNFCAQYIMRNAGLEETQAEITIAGRNINNHRYADDTALMAESEEELKSLLMKVKEESEHVGQPCGKASWESLVGKPRGKASRESH